MAREKSQTKTLRWWNPFSFYPYGTNSMVQGVEYGYDESGGSISCIIKELN